MLKQFSVKIVNIKKIKEAFEIGNFFQRNTRNILDVSADLVLDPASDELNCQKKLRMKRRDIIFV